MTVPAVFVIADDLSFRLDDIRSSRTEQAVTPGAVTYELLEKTSRRSIATGVMSLYDAGNGTTIGPSYDAVIDASNLALYNGTIGVKPLEKHVLRATIDNAGVKTTKAAELVAVLDPPKTE